MNIWDAVVGYFWMSRIRQLPVLWINLYKNMFHLSHCFSPVYKNLVQCLQKLYCWEHIETGSKTSEPEKSRTTEINYW